MNISTLILKSLSLIIFTVLSIGSDCNESLPPYIEPDSVYDLHLSSINYPVDGATRAVEDLYKYPMTFNLKLKNTYDELLAGPAVLSLGRIDIWWENNPAVQAIAAVTPDEEHRTHVFQHFIQFAPGDSAEFIVYWQHVDINDNGIWMSAETETITSQGIRIYEPMQFNAQAMLQPIAGGPSVYSNEFTFIVTYTKIQTEDDEG